MNHLPDRSDLITWKGRTEKGMGASQAHRCSIQRGKQHQGLLCRSHQLDGHTTTSRHHHLW